MERGCGECWRGTPGLEGPLGKGEVGGLEREGAAGSQEGRCVGTIHLPRGTGPREPVSFPPPLLLPARRKLSQRPPTLVTSSFSPYPPRLAAPSRTTPSSRRWGGGRGCGWRCPVSFSWVANLGLPFSCAPWSGAPAISHRG